MLALPQCGSPSQGDGVAATTSQHRTPVHKAPTPQGTCCFARELGGREQQPPPSFLRATTWIVESAADTEGHGPRPTVGGSHVRLAVGAQHCTVLTCDM